MNQPARAQEVPEMLATAPIPLSEIQPSPTNPRKNFEKGGLEELAASLQQLGMLQPVLLRRLPEKKAPKAGGEADGIRYEIVAGERRFRAAKLAGWEMVPALVRTMSDQEVLEAQCIENLQRKDLHPLEEAQGYHQLASIGGYDAARIAERIGRSVKYVYDRIKLLSLTREAQQLFLEGKFQAGHAILLARLKPEDQERALRVDARHPGLFTDECTLWDPRRADDEEWEKSVKAVSVREFQRWIDLHVKFDVQTVDPMLFPETAETIKAAIGPGGGAYEKAAKIVSITYEYRPHDDVRAAAQGQRIFGQPSWKRAGVTGQGKPCDRSVIGVVVCGPGRGEAFPVCTDKQGCKIHWGAEQREARKRATAGAVSGGKAVDTYELREQKRKEEVARAEAKRQSWMKALPRILEALAEKVQRAPTKATGLLADVILRHVRKRHPTMKLDYVPRGSSAEDLVRHAAFHVLAGEASDSWMGPLYFPKRARAFGIDVKKILAAAAPAVVTKKEKAGKPEAGTCRKCRCTEENACEGGCSWVDGSKTRCSSCFPVVAEKAKGARKE